METQQEPVAPRKSVLPYVIGTGLVILFAAAALLAGRLFNGGLIENAVPVSVNFIPALELPAVHSDVTGAFVERQDHTITVATRSHGQSGSQVEILVTGNTMIYRETTQHDEPLTAGVQNIQQTVEEGDLDQLSSEFTLAVWGRRSGDRIIAEVLVYSNIPMIKRMLFEDCDACP